MKPIWLMWGFISLGLGIIGIILPVLPTTPFILLAGFCFARSSERFHHMLVSHKIFGPLITDWQAKGAIAPQAKFLAAFMMAAVFLGSVYFGVPTYALVLQAICLLGAATYVLTRPHN